MKVNSLQINQWISLLRSRATSGQLALEDVFDTLEEVMGDDLDPPVFDLRDIPDNLDDDPLADALGKDMFEALDTDAAGAVFDIKIVDSKYLEQPELDQAIRSWMINLLSLATSLTNQEAANLKDIVDSLESRVFIQPGTHSISTTNQSQLHGTFNVSL